MTRRNELDRIASLLENDERDIFQMVARRKPLEVIAEKIGLPQHQIRQLIHSARFAFGANDELVDEYLQMVEGWEIETGSKLFLDNEGDNTGDRALVVDTPSSSKSEIIGEIEARLAPSEMRDLASSLLKLADAFDQNWSPDSVQAEFHWPSGAARIERNSIELARRAVVLLRQRTDREQFLPSEIFGEPGWNMLLDLFIQFSGGAKVSVKSLCIAAGCPHSTALRHIARLDELGLIRRQASTTDARVVLYSLTRKGVIGVGRVLERISV